MNTLFAGAAWEPSAWAMLGLFGLLGLLAVVSPRRFSGVSTWSSRWIDVDRVLGLLGKPIDIDRYVLPHARLLGVLVLIAVGTMAYLTHRYLIY